MNASWQQSEEATKDVFFIAWEARLPCNGCQYGETLDPLRPFTRGYLRVRYLRPAMVSSHWCCLDSTLAVSGFNISSRSELEPLARGVIARIGSLIGLTLDNILLDSEDKTGFLDPILLALTILLYLVSQEIVTSCLVFH
jgi:hypothetical protein